MILHEATVKERTNTMDANATDPRASRFRARRSWKRLTIAGTALWLGALCLGAPALRSEEAPADPADLLAAALATDTDLRVRFRMARTERTATVAITPGLPDGAARAANPHTIAVTAHADGSAQRQRSPDALNVSGTTYTLRHLPARRMQYPDLARARMEQDFAALEGINARWLTARHVLRADAVQAYLDGRFFRETPTATHSASG